MRLQGAPTFDMVASSSLGPAVPAVTEAFDGSDATASLVLASTPLAALDFSLTPEHRRRPISPDLAVAAS